jgi:hypothetical protein
MEMHRSTATNPDELLLQSLWLATLGHSVRDSHARRRS